MLEVQSCTHNTSSTTITLSLYIRTSTAGIFVEWEYNQEIRTTTAGIMLEWTNVYLEPSNVSHNITSTSPKVSTALHVENINHQQTTGAINLYQPGLAFSLSINYSTIYITTEDGQYIYTEESYIEDLLTEDSEYIFTENAGIITLDTLIAGYHLQTADNVILSPQEGITLTVSGATQNITSNNITLLEKFTLSVNSTVQTITSSNIILMQRSILSVNNSSQLHTVNSVALMQKSTLSVNNSSQLHTVNSVALMQKSTLSVNNSSQIISSSNISLLQHHILQINNSVQTIQSDKIDLEQHQYGILFVYNCSHAQTSSTVSLTQHQILSLNNVTKSISSSNILLNIKFSLIIGSASQSITSGEYIISPTDYILTSEYIAVYGMPEQYFPYGFSSLLRLVYHPALASITVNNASHTQTAQSIILTYHPFSVLSVNNCSHAHSASTVNLLAHYSLTVSNSVHNIISTNINFNHIHPQNSNHLISSQNIDLTQHHVLEIASCIQQQITDNAILIYYFFSARLEISSCTHLQACSEVTLSNFRFPIIVRNANHSHTAGNVALKQNHVLSVNNAIHSQTATSPVLWYHIIGAVTLEMHNCNQTQTSDKISFTTHLPISVNNCEQHIRSSKITFVIEGMLSPTPLWADIKIGIGIKGIGI